MTEEKNTIHNRPGASALICSARVPRQKEPAVTDAAETEDTLFQGRLRFYQARTGYRFSLDAILLACFAAIKINDKVVDLGTGSGVIPAVIAYRQPLASIVGVEIQERMAARARRNVEMNKLHTRIQIVQGDVRAIDRIAAPGSFDAAVCNPPYRSPSSGRVSPDPEKQIARHEVLGTLRHFLGAGGYLLPVRGRMSLVYPAARAIDLLEGMRSAGLEPKRLKTVHSFAGAEASLVLVEGIKGGKGGLKLLSPLIVYKRPKTYSAEIQAMLNGAMLSL